MAGPLRIGARPRQWPLSLPYLAFAIIVPANLALLAFPGPGPLVTALSFLVLELLGLAFSLRAATHPRLDPAARRPWRFMAVCFLLLVVFGATFGMAQTTGKPLTVLTPALAVAISCRVLFVPLFLGGLLSFAAQPLDRGERWKLAMDLTTVIGVGLMLMWYFLIGPILGTLDPRAGVRPELILVIYPIADFGLIVGLSTVLLRGVITSARRSVQLLLFATVAYLAANLVATYLAVHNSGQITSVRMNLLFLMPAFLMAAAAAEQCRQAGEQRAALRPSRPILPNNYLPFVALFCGYALLATAAARTGLFPWTGLIASAAVMTFGVAARQAIALRENHALVIADALTGLASRLRLRDVMNRALERGDRSDTPMAVLLIDLNGFKQVNDTLGHEAGDLLLVAFADVLRRTVRRTDTAARLGGDEFAVLLDTVNGAEDAIAVAERILDQARTPIAIAGQQVPIRASIGIAVTDPADGPVTPNELLHRADSAMYVAKRTKSAGWHRHIGPVTESGQDAAVLGQDLLAATAAGQLRIMYQPIIALDADEQVAVEALVRWEHPVRGPIAPLAFIPLAEEIGAIHDIGAWVLERACRQVRAWQDRFPPGRTLCLSVNLSTRQLERETLAAEVLAVLAETGFDARRLVLEITEDALADERTSVPQLQELRDHGIRIALDDFGTGYASLRHVTQLPIDILKLDRCFVAELNGSPEGAAVAEAVMRLGQLLHLDTVAEGIEEPAQATELTRLGYRNLQGFHFARPLPPEAIDDLIDADSAWPRLPALPGSRAVSPG
ncbi:MAG: EAL domain-containing protein [Dactylosporangium sp.]|nr:EAL domain-containing protein [Dactylosporangium sp.]NNJ60296.1 EAL domain-containing protein [Dactylosporangium sp.]